MLDNALEDIADALCGVCADGGAQFLGLCREAALAVGVVHAIHQVGLHFHAIVGDGASHHGHLHHGGLRAGGAFMVHGVHRLAGGGPGGFPFGHLARVGHERRIHDDGEVQVLVEPEALGAFHQLIGAHLHAQLAVDGVRRPPRGLFERLRAVAGLVEVRHAGVADGDGARRRERGGLACHVVLDRRGQGDHLERGAGRVQRARGAVDQRGLGRAGVRLRDHLLEVRGIVGGCAGKRQDGAGLRVHDHRCAHVAGKRVLGSLLDFRVDGERDVVAGGAHARHVVEHVGPAGEALLAFQGLVVRGLDARGAVLLRHVSDHVGGQVAGGVDALVASVVVRGAACQHDAVVGGDGAALALRFLGERVVVARHGLV